MKAKCLGLYEGILQQARVYSLFIDEDPTDKDLSLATIELEYGEVSLSGYAFK